MQSVTLNVPVFEMEKAVKGQEFVGYPEDSRSGCYKMRVYFPDIIGMKYADPGGYPEAVVCKLKRGAY